MDNSFSSIHPELVCEWSDKNAPLTPEQITYLPSHVILESRFGLQQDSMVMLEQIRTVNRSDLQKYIGSIDDESVWRKINNAIKKTFGLWFYNLERTGDIRCLCSKCLSDYKKNPSFVVKRLDPFSKKEEKCDRCDNLGYDYLVFDKRASK